MGAKTLGEKSVLLITCNSNRLDTLRGRNDDDGASDDGADDTAKTELMSKIIRYYRTPLHLLDVGIRSGTESSSNNGPFQAKRTIATSTADKFHSALLYYLTHDFAHLQNILLFDAWLTQRAHLLLAAAAAAAKRQPQPQPHQQQQQLKDPATNEGRAVYIPRALIL